MMTKSPKSAADPGDLRAAIARSGIPSYVIGARARINPVKLSRILNGHLRVTHETAARILIAIQQEIAHLDCQAGAGEGASR